MQLEKAIEILELWYKGGYASKIADLNPAVKLSIEALKVILEWRHYPFPDGVLKLPGED